MLVNATLLHVEEGRVVELAHGRSVRTLHVVGVDLKHGLRVHTRRLGHAEVLVGLLRGGLLGSMAHQHTTGEGTHGMSIEHIFIELMRVAMAHLMVDERIVVHTLAFVGYDTAVAPTLSPFALEGEIEHVAGGAVMKRDDIMAHATVGLLLNIHVAHTCVLLVGLLQAVEVETRILTHIGLNDLCGEEVAVVGRVVTEEKLGLSALIHNDEHTAVDHQVDIGAENIDHLDGTLHLDTFGHMDEQAILSQHGVEGGNGVVGSLRQLGVTAFHQFGMHLSGLTQAHHLHPLGQRGLGEHLLIERVVHHEIK